MPWTGIIEPRLQQIGEALARPDIIEAFRREMARKRNPLRQGPTENATVVGELLGDLMDRGLDFSQPPLYVLDGGKALSTAVKKHGGESAPLQRCQVHKRRNVLDNLPVFPRRAGRMGQCPRPPRYVTRWRRRLCAARVRSRGRGGSPAGRKSGSGGARSPPRRRDRRGFSTGPALPGSPSLFPG